MKSRYICFVVLVLLSLLGCAPTGSQSGNQTPWVTAEQLNSESAQFKGKYVAITGIATKELGGHVYYELAYQYDVIDGEMDWSLSPVSVKTWELTDETGSVTIASEEHASFLRLLRIGKVNLQTPQNKRPENKIQVVGKWVKDEKGGGYYLKVSSIAPVE